MALKITTNNVPRDILHPWDLTDKECAWFDYHDFTDENLDATFVRYRGVTYDLSDGFIATGGDIVNPDFKGWDGYMSDSFFSGIVIRYTDDYEQVVMGTYYITSGED